MTTRPADGLTWPDGFYVVYDYDPAGEMAAARANGSTSFPTLRNAI